MQNSFLMKTVQNPTIFVKNQKKKENRKMIIFGKFFEVFTETLEQNIRKSNKKKFFLDGKEDK